MLPDGLHAFVRQGCPTSRLVVPVLAALQRADTGLTVHSQDDPRYGDGEVAVTDDRQLEEAYEASGMSLVSRHRTGSDRFHGRSTSGAPRPRPTARAGRPSGPRVRRV